MTECCRFAFNSKEEKREWQFLKDELETLDTFPVEYLIECAENIDRLQRHGYTVTLSCAPNLYEIAKKG